MLSAINFVAENWMTEMMKVHPHLMSAAGVEPAFEQAHLV